MRCGEANLVWMWVADAHAKRKEGRSLFYGGRTAPVTASRNRSYSY